VRNTPGLTLADGLDLAGISEEQLWARYMALGGDATLPELRAHVIDPGIDDYEHDVIAQAINEYFLDSGQDHPVAYWRPPAVLVDPPADEA
jgi:hypothetical protein